MAFFENKFSDAKIFLNKGFENGLRLDSLKVIKSVDYSGNEKRVKIFDTIFKSKFLYNELKLMYNKSRPKYLKRINKEILLRISENYFVDQSNKNTRIFYNESKENRNLRYSTFLKKNMVYLDSITANFALPLEKVCGVTQDDILKELGYNNRDVIDYFNKTSVVNRKVLNISEDQFVGDEDLLTSELTFVQFLHYPCYYFENKNNFLKRIDKGEMHPRDAGMLHDFTFAFAKSKEKYDKKIVENKNYYNCIFSDYSELNYKMLIWFEPQIYYSSDIELLNQRRQKILINTYEVDIAMKNFEMENNLKLISFGFFRSM